MLPKAIHKMLFYIRFKRVLVVKLNLSCLRTFEFRTPLGTSLLLMLDGKAFQSLIAL